MARSSRSFTLLAFGGRVERRALLPLSARLNEVVPANREEHDRGDQREVHPSHREAERAKLVEIRIGHRARELDERREHLVARDLREPREDDPRVDQPRVYLQALDPAVERAVDDRVHVGRKRHRYAVRALQRSKRRTPAKRLPRGQRRRENRRWENGGICRRKEPREKSEESHGEHGVQHEGSAPVHQSIVLPPVQSIVLPLVLTI